VGVQQQRGQQPLDPGRLGLQFGGGVAADGHIQPDPKQPPLPSGQPAGQLLGILAGRFDLGVAEAAAGGVEPLGGCQAGQLAAQPFGCDRGGQRVAVEGDVDGAGMVQQRFQPPRPDLAGVAGHRQRPVADAAGLQRGRGDLDGVGAGQPCRDRRGPPPAQ
jgi:hypothetical protein